MLVACCCLGASIICSRSRLACLPPTRASLPRPAQGDRRAAELRGLSLLGVTQIDRVVEAVEETLKGHTVQLLAKKALPRLDLPKVRPGGGMGREAWRSRAAGLHARKWRAQGGAL